MPITDRYGNELKQPEQKPTLQQSLDSWALLNELIELGYAHNFHNGDRWVANYLYDLSALIDKAFKIKKEVEQSDAE